MRFKSVFLAAFIATGLTGPGFADPDETKPFACELQDKRPDWVRAMTHTENRWGLTTDAQLALISYEWSLEDQQLPSSWRPSWSLPGRAQPGMTPGYFDATWERYKYETGAKNASVRDFADFSDFMGWYLTSTASLTNVLPGDAAGLYILWRRGPRYYTSGEWRRDTGMISQSEKFAYRAQQISDDLASCSIYSENVADSHDQSIIVQAVYRPWKWVRTRANQIPWFRH